MGGATSRNADSLFDARVIAFRNKVPTAFGLLIVPDCFAPDCYFRSVYSTFAHFVPRASLALQVNTVLTVPMMRTWCKANGTTLFIAPASGEYIGHQRQGAAAEVMRPRMSLHVSVNPSTLLLGSTGKAHFQFSNIEPLLLPYSPRYHQRARHGLQGFGKK